MFAEACGAAKEFARPVLVSDPKNSWAGCGTFMVLNRSGWAVTAKHILGEALEKDGADLVWGWEGVVADEVILDDDTDLAAVRLDPFEPERISDYPMLMDGDAISLGTSFGRLGYAVEEGCGIASALPLFNSGIISRICGGPDTGYIVTSSAGIKGQSGGPVFGCDGCVMGMQTSTRRSHLGYSGADDRGVMRPLMSVEGIALHIGSVRRFLDAAGISYRIRASES